MVLAPLHFKGEVVALCLGVMPGGGLGEYTYTVWFMARAVGVVASCLDAGVWAIWSLPIWLRNPVATRTELTRSGYGSCNISTHTIHGSPR